MQDQPPGALTTILFHLSTIDNDLTAFKAQLALYDTTRENDLKLQRITDTASRMETDIKTIRTSLEGAIAALSALQIKVLASAVTLIAGALVTLLIFYITHL